MPDQSIPAVTSPPVSVVIPALNEAENLPGLIAEIIAAMPTVHEVIVVDDGSTDDTAEVIGKLGEEDPRIKVISHPRPFGQSGAVATGVRAATGEIVVTLDGDGQNDPRFIPEMVAVLKDPSIGLVAGQRLGRKDTFSKRMGSKIANKVRGAMLGDSTRDTGCGLKAFRRDAYLDLPFFDALHRFMPALFMSDGWKIGHVDVVDRPRQFGASKYTNWNRLMIGIPDLFGVWWLRRRRQRNPVTMLKDR